MKIEIFTRSMNYMLYDAAMYTIRDLPYRRHRLRSTTSDGYLLAMLRSDADWAINIDEDAFVTDIEALKNLLQYCINNKIVNCGMQDGGLLPIREHNPLVTNPFFNILNLTELRKQYDPELVSSYSIHRSEYERKSPEISGAYNYDYFEPYCTFFVWVSQNFKTFYLNAETHQDGISTVLLDHSGAPFLTHTWYSRFYGVVGNVHTERINAVIDRYSRRTPYNICRDIGDKIANKIVYPIYKKIKT